MITCPHCGREFEKPKPIGKWYFSNYWVIIGLLCAGPLALPLVWLNPNYRTLTKWVLSILVLAATVIIIIISIILIKILIDQFRQLMHI